MVNGVRIAGMENDPDCCVQRDMKSWCAFSAVVYMKMGDDSGF